MKVSIIGTGNHPEQKIDEVAIWSEYTFEGVHEMEHQGFSSSIINGLATSYNKINQI